MKRIFTIILMTSGTFLWSQTFTKITDSPMQTETPTGGYSGVSWIDYDGDDDLDLFVNQDFLYQNDGNGNFIKIENSGIVGWGSGINNGNSWADFDNDGDLDLALANQGSNGVFSNNGDGTFSKITTGDIATNLNAWSVAWADYDNDGWLDLMGTHPCGFIGTCHANWLFKNDSNGNFDEITDTDINLGFAAYTVGNWADFDDDGDMDLFVGSGEVGFTSKDHIYINQLTETGTADFILNQDGVLFGENRDGQNWNLIDYDNDGDLDAFVTNYKADVPNDFYKNNGDGTFTKLTDSDLGVHIVSEAAVWLANTWGDFNNDGWLDVFITADFGSPFGNHLYMSNGDGTFEHLFPAFANQVGSRAAANGDYDNDGDLDLFINATQASLRGLYRNDLTLGANQNWINIALEGTISNRSAVGAKVHLKATINGETFWQRRDISTQNTFCGQNSMRLHFGLGNATTIDSLVIEWPLGLEEIYTSISSNQFLKIIEGEPLGLSDLEKEKIALTIFPNPTQSEININYQVLHSNQKVQIKILDNSLREVRTVFEGVQQKGFQEFNLKTDGWISGNYYLILKSEGAILSKKVVIIK